jgi:hypothetical protein
MMPREDFKAFLKFRLDGRPTPGPASAAPKPKRVLSGLAGARAALREQRRRRIAELHPDKIGREQTEQERREYVALTSRKRR